MPKRIALGTLLGLGVAAPGRADLRYVMHTEARQVTLTEPVNAMLVMAADMVVRAMLPEGPSDSIYRVSDKGVRVEHTKASAMMPAGTVMLSLVDGTTIVINPHEKTYWQI